MLGNFYLNCLKVFKTVGYVLLFRNNLRKLVGKNFNMPKIKGKPVKIGENATTRTSALYKYASKDNLVDVLCNPKHLNVTCWALILFEVFLNLLIVQNVRYTEIDWIAYMQEVEGFLNGTLDYKLLRGDTGPLVYPAGFVYIYSLFYFVTSHGQNIVLAQYVFLALYIAQLYLAFRIYRKTTKVPPYALIISTLTSYRIHSIYVLRLFNDPIAVLLFYISLNLFLSNSWVLGSIFYSLAVSVKMNVLLYAPCLLIAYLTNLTLTQTFVSLFVCGAVQLILGMPFLCTNPWAYIQGSFDLGRVFEHKWTVNYRFLSESTFESRRFHVGLLALHVSLLLTFLPAFRRYLSSYAKLKWIAGELEGDVKHGKHSRNEKVAESEELRINFNRSAQLMVLPFFVANLIGVACARSLHYQFYSWYFHSLLYLAYCTNYPKSVVFLVLGVIELCWNTYPSTALSSAALHVCHVVLLAGVYKYMSK